MVGWLRGTGAFVYRELLSLFVTPLGYLVGTLFLLLQGWNFSLLLRFLNDPLAAPGPVMQFYFGGSFFIFWLPVVFTCSAISMGLIAEERKQGTLEAVLTAPVSAAQVVIGKFLGAYVFYALLWLPTGVFYVLLVGAGESSGMGGPDVGPIVSGYLGTMLVGGSFLAIGVLASALSRSQLAAAIGTFVTCSIVLMGGLLVDQVESARLSGLLEWTSLLTMMQEMAQGIVDSHWVWLHAAIIISALALAVSAMDPRRDAQRVFQAVLFGVAVSHFAVFAARHGTRGDWTGGQVYTLSERADKVLADLHGPIDVTVLIPTTIGDGRPNPLLGEVREVLSRMRAASPALRVRLVDPDRVRQEAEQLILDYGLGGRELSDGVLLIRAGQGADLRRAHLLPSDLVTYATGPEVQATGPRVKAFRGEEAMLRKFLEVSEARKLRACYTQGHGEPEYDNLEPYAGYAHLRDLLRDANLETRVADLDGADGLAECDVLVIGGPQGRMPRGHLRAVERYAEAGGDILMLSGAVILRARAGLAAHGLEDFTRSYGIGFGERVVLDPNPMPGNAPLRAFTLSTGWGDHPAVHSLIMRPVSFVLVRELTIEDPASLLMESSQQGWAEADVDGIKTGAVPQYDEGPDRQGPVPIAAASERNGSRLVVIASDQFALNALLREDIAYDHGRDLLLNVIGWLTQREALLGIRPREREHVKLVLQQRQLTRMTWICLAGLPGFSIILGLLVLWRRRR